MEPRRNCRRAAEAGRGHAHARPAELLAGLSLIGISTAKPLSAEILNATELDDL
jgi:hypothetical protein